LIGVVSVTETVIVTQELSKRFGAIRAVDRLSLSVPRGTVFGFLGPNRAGKTTTIRLLLGLVYPTAGRAQVLGRDIVSERDAFLPQVGALVESPAYYPYLSGRTNLRILGHTGGYHEEKRIDEVLDLVGLTDRQHDKVRSYSLGMKQRLAVAATLLNRPQLLFLDEPTNGLDPAGQAEMRELVRSLGQAGHTVFLSSHLLHEVEQVCDRVAIINKGQLIAQGSVAELLNQQPTLRIEAEPIEQARDIVSRIVQTNVATGDGDRFVVEAGRERAPEIVKALSDAGVRVYQVVAARPTLEEFFLRVTGADDAAGRERAP
jgi:ABC-2 type transport system ATP-binding protein